MIVSSRLLSYIFILASIAIAHPVAAVTVIDFFDDFEAENLELNYVDFDNWIVSGGTVDTVGPTFGTPLIDCQGSSVCVDVDGSTGDAANALATKDDFAPGAYRLSFDISGSQRPDTNTINVSFGNLDEDFTLAGSAPWVTVVRNVNLASNDQLVFGMTGGDNSGILLDNVTVSAVPLPGVVWLFAPVVLGLMSLRRRLD